jgi:opacity protein-like surface antigen
MIRPLALAVLAANLAAPAAAADLANGAATVGWQFEVTPYVWLPTIGGTFRGDAAGGGSTDFEVKPGSYLKGFESGIAVTGEVRKGRVFVYSDLMYLRLGSENSTVIGVDPGLVLDTSFNFKMAMWSIVGGYAVATGDWGRVDAFAGARMAGTDFTGSFDLSFKPAASGRSTNSFAGSETIWNGIVGTKGRIQLNRAWFLPFYADFGTGDSNFTYQLAAGIGYQTGWLGVSAGWRTLVMNQAADEPVDTLTLKGPVLSFNMNF